MLATLTVLAALSSPQVDVYTMGRGEPLYERFGHAAICVRGESMRSTRCYNFGTTDFGSPPAELGWHFLRGTARFWVSVSPLERMIASYARADRTLWRQKLPLSPEEARALARILERSALPEHREYVYHHLDDNCSTRVRDVIDDATGGALTRDADERIDHTFRTLGRARLGDEPLASWLADLFVGRRVDERPTRREAMFLPEYLRASIHERFGAEPELVHRRRAAPVPSGQSGSWWQFLALAALAALSGGLGLLARSATARRAGVIVSLAIPSALGLAVWAVALSTAVTELRLNEALAVFLPTDVLLGALRGRWRDRLLRARLVELFAVSALLAVGVLRQPLLAAVLVPATALFALKGSEKPPQR